MYVYLLMLTYSPISTLGHHLSSRLGYWFLIIIHPCHLPCPQHPLAGFTHSHFLFVAYPFDIGVTLLRISLDRRAYIG
jgi:hypothetical protein